MGENLADALLKVADLLRWFKAYTESNALVMLSRFLRAKDLHDLDTLTAFVEAEERHAD